MEIRCENLGSEEIAIDAIKSVIQIYRFDDFRISLEGEDELIIFDVPSTEWLETFTELLRADPPADFNRTLRISGWLFRALRTETAVTLFIETKQRHDLTINLTLEEAKRLHDVVLDVILRPFVEQGGEIKNVSDIQKLLL